MEADPRLSQLFQLSNQLEELANSIECGPLPFSMDSSADKGKKTPNGNTPLGIYSQGEVQYQRLSNSAPLPEEELLLSRFSMVSDMSTSSQSQEGIKTGSEYKPNRFNPDWQARCVDLEMSLQQFRDQAKTIRELLKVKVKN